MTPYTLGAFGAVHHLRQVLVYVNTATMQQPEFYLSNVAEVMDEQGKITDEETKKHIADFWEAYQKWIGNFINTNYN